MKIGIFTFHHSLNCGAALQAWALQEYLRSQGFDASLVNYGKIGWPCKYRIRCDSPRAFAASLVRSGIIFFQSFAIENYRRCLYWRFMRGNMKLGRAVAKKSINAEGYTHLIVGSDQVWHPVINEGDDTYFFANTPDGVKRISYAPSFGVDEFDPELERKMAGWLARFDSLSAREPQGAEIVKRLCGREATVVCDPTLLLPREAYIRLERRPCFALPVKYIAVYTVCGHPWAEDAALKIGAARGLLVVHLLGGQLARWYWSGRARRVTAMGPSEWLWFIHHAEYVVTNSFHGTVFSLMFHKPFTVAFNGKASDARMLSLLDGVGLNDAFNTEPQRSRGDRRDYMNVDWGKVDAGVMHIAETGKKYLKEVLR